MVCAWMVWGWGILTGLQLLDPNGTVLHVSYSRDGSEFKNVNDFVESLFSFIICVFRRKRKSLGWFLT